MLTVSDNHIVLGGGGGGGGSTTFVGLSDKETADLPGTNTPLANALSGKEASANKKTDVDANKTSDTFFPSVKAVFDWVSGLFVKGAASSTDNAIARFDGVTGKALKNSLVTIDDNGSTILNSTGNLGLRVIGAGNSIGTWRGRIIAGGENVAFLMGEYNGSAWLGAHNVGLTAWSDFYVNPDGFNTLFLGSSTNLTHIRSAVKLDSATLLDNTGRAGTDGQVLKKVGGLVVWANP